jgi:hypothetical protein
MKIYTNGYAIGGIGMEEALKLLGELPLESGSSGLKPLHDDIDYKEWLGRFAEVKCLATGTYIESEYILPDDTLVGLSLHTAGLLHLCHYENMEGYSCSYFLDGKKLLDRFSVAAGTLKDEDVGHEFTGLHTQDVIKQLFTRLSGAALEEGDAAKGLPCYFAKTGHDDSAGSSTDTIVQG